jgi:hypothetical protein
MDETPLKLRYGIPLGLDVAAVGLALVLHDGLMAYQASARFTGRVSLALFATIAILFALPRHRDLARRMMPPFAAAHLFHFACLATFLQLAGSWPAPTRLLGGGLAYALIVAMPLFQTFAGMRALAEGVYLGWVGFIFLMSYVLRLLGKVPEAGGSRSEHLALLGVVVATALAHFALRFRARAPA